jgi:hypothetical protein
MSQTAICCVIAFVLPFVILGFLSWLKFNQMTRISSDTRENDLPNDNKRGSADSVPDELNVKA